MSRTYGPERHEHVAERPSASIPFLARRRLYSAETQWTAASAKNPVTPAEYFPRQPSPEPRSRSRKSPMLASLLQCVPLLFAAGCVSAAYNGGQSAAHWGELLSLSMFLAGIGYLYLERTSRFGAALLTGAGLWIFTVFCFNIQFLNSLGCGSIDFQQCLREQAHADIPGAVRTALLVGSFVLYCAVDAWRLARRQNARRKAGEGPEVEAPEQGTDSENADL